MHFGENQLSPSLIGLSPLPTGHPPGFQPWWVRASTQSYPRFTLPIGRSLGFGSRTRNTNALFRLAFATAPPPGLTTLRTLTRRLILQKARHHPPKKVSSDGLQAPGFRSYFTPLTGVLFTIPSRYSCTIGRWEYLGLPDGPGRFTRDYPSPALLGDTAKKTRPGFTYRTLTVYGAPSQTLQLPRTKASRQGDGPSQANPTTPTTQHPST
jgi:hypothetical protein